MRRAYARGSADIRRRREDKALAAERQAWEDLQLTPLWWTGWLDESLGSEMLEANERFLTKAQWKNGYLVTIARGLKKDPEAKTQHLRWVNDFATRGLLIKDRSEIEMHPLQSLSFDGGSKLWNRIKRRRA